MRSLINFALNVFAIAVALWAVVTVIPGISITPAETCLLYTSPSPRD